MKTERVLKPNIGLSKKEEKRKVKKEKLNKELNHKLELQREAREQIEKEKLESLSTFTPEEPVMMGGKLRELISHISEQGSEKKPQDPRRQKKRIDQMAIQQMKEILNNPEFQNNPEGAFSVVNQELITKSFCKK